jgi:uncharacterized protein (UPF0332 family)
MPFDWTTYLDLARELAGRGSGPSFEEARLRSAISRAYYAAFKQAFNYLCDKDPTIRFQREGVHQYVYEKFWYSRDAGWRRVGSELDRLRRLRNRADYDDLMTDLSADTRMALAYAAEIIDTLGKLP